MKKPEFHFINGKPGHLPWNYIVRIALANIVHTRSRTLIATAAMAVGVGAVVLLVSFGYGLQNIIVSRLLRPNSLRLADVQSSSTALSLTPESLNSIRKIPFVEAVSASISLAGSLTYNNSKTEVVVIALTNKFLDLSSISPIAGTVFSKQAELSTSSTCPPNTPECASEIEKLLSFVQKGEVAGVFSKKPDVRMGATVSENTMRFRIKEDDYIPIRKTPIASAPILGYVTGSLFTSFQGKEVWGGVYESVNAAGKSYQDQTGEWWGKWIETKLPLYTKIDETTYVPQQDAQGGQTSGHGFIAEARSQILSTEQVTLERQMNELEKKVAGKVLGVASEAGVLSASTSATTVSTDEAALKALVFGQTPAAVAESSPSAQLGLVEMKKSTGHEAIVSTGFLNALKLKPQDILKKEVSLEYIIGGGQITGVAGRIMSKPVIYTVVGIIRDDKRSMFFTPIADVESLGVRKYTVAKVLVRDTQHLTAVREKIQSIGFITQSLTDTLIQIDKLFRIMRFLLGAFGAIALVVAVFGMFNTLTVSLLERTREIGVMKTLGTRDSDVVRLFMVESAIIAFFGGIFGIVFGVVMGNIINMISSFFRDDKSVSLFHSPAIFIVAVMCAAVIIGVLTGLYPSLRSKNISALDALRYE